MEQKEQGRVIEKSINGCSVTLSFLRKLSSDVMENIQSSCLMHMENVCKRTCRQYKTGEMIKSQNCGKEIRTFVNVSIISYDRAEGNTAP